MSTIARKSAETFAVRLFIQLCSVGAGILLARVLGPAGKGAFTYAATVLATAGMIYAGQSAAISWQYGKRRLPPLQVLGAATKLYAATVLPLVAGTAAVALFMPRERILLFVAVALPFSLLMQVSQGFFLADSDVRSVNVQQMFPTVLAAVLYAPVLLLAHRGLEGVLAVWVAAYAAGALFSTIRLSPIFKGQRLRAGAGLVREQLGYGSQISLNSVVSYLNFRIDVFIVLAVLGPRQLGIYSIGIAAGELLFQITRPINTAAFGRITRAGEAESAQLTATCMRHSMVLSLIFGAIAFAAAPMLIPLVYGSQFAPAGLVLRVLMPGVIAYSTMPVLATFFSQQLGTPRIPLIFSAISMVICGALTIATIHRFGIVAGALATSVSYVAAFIAATVYFSRRSGIGVKDLFLPRRGDVEPYRALFESTLRAPRRLVARFSGR
jgi:O-antigen/teichoic acid export membrane protein